ncbi:MAG TPA: hypothetical protein PLQ09_02140 [Prolixibacteraceae bacterium]|nr:hypothetical protein [Prolixibacteraceae bacterium]
MKKKNQFMNVFSVFQNTESYFDERSKEETRKLILQQMAIICLFTFLYGVVMGSYHSFLQSLVAGLKVTFLFLSTIAICFPSFFVIQQVLGSKMPLSQMLVIILSGFVLTASIAFSFAPIIILFQITGGNYHFLQLLHVAIFIFSGIFGMRLMVDALKYACERKSIYPHIGVSVFKIWFIILAFVGIQLSWNLRPFLCNKNEDFKLFREYEGNFYTAIVYSVKQLWSSSNDTDNKEAVTGIPSKDSLNQLNDTMVFNLLNEK